jgi:hypothetical protein
MYPDAIRANPQVIMLRIGLLLQLALNCRGGERMSRQLLADSVEKVGGCAG